MTEENIRTYRANVQAKAQEIRDLVTEVFSLLPNAADERQKEIFQEKLQQVTRKCEFMHEMFGTNLVPKPLREITQKLQHWRLNLTDGGCIRRIAELLGPISSINGEEEDADSFVAIFEKHREDKTLQDCLDELIKALEKLLTEGDETLNAQAARELQRVLDQLKKRKGKSLPDLQPWVDYALTSIATLADFYHGTPVATLIFGALIAAKNSQVRLDHLFRDSAREYFESLKLTRQAKWEENFQAKLKAASVAEITKALESPGGLKSLPDPSGNLALPPSPEAQPDR